jgi:hypothetical protein
MQGLSADIKLRKRKNRIFLMKYAVLKGGGGIRIRTLEGIASRFTVCTNIPLSLHDIDYSVHYDVDTRPYFIYVVAN